MADNNETLESLTKELGQATAKLTKQQEELKDAHREVMKSIEDATKLDKEQRQNIDAAISKANETAQIVGELSQKMDEVKKSVVERGERPTVRSAIMKELAGDAKQKYELLKSRDSNSMRLVLKAITTSDVSTGMKTEAYIDSLVGLERQPLRIKDLLTIIPVTSDSVKYGKQTLRDNKAKIVAETAQKPYSNYKWEAATATIETMAHLTKMTLQAVADAPRLAAEVESEMRYGLALIEEDEILNGDGTSGHLSGLIENSTAYAVPAGMATSNILTPLDRLRVAILQVHLAYAVPDAHVLNAVNMAEIDLMRRDPDQGGGYLFGNPNTQTGVATLWRLPVVESQSMTVGQFLTGAFRYSAHLYDRQMTTVQISTENDTDFELNLATMRCESRIGLGVRRSYGLVSGALSGSGS